MRGVQEETNEGGVGGTVERRTVERGTVERGDEGARGRRERGRGKG